MCVQIVGETRQVGIIATGVWEFASARGTDFHVKFSDDVDVKAALYNRAGKLIEFSREAWS